MIEKMSEIYDNAPTLKDWESANTVDDEMVYKGASTYQNSRLASVSEIMNVDYPKVVGTHRSKSINLPVTAYKFVGWMGEMVFAVLRDNFYDLEAYIISSHKMEIDLYHIYPYMTEEQYKHKRMRAMEYLKGRADEYDFDGLSWYKDYSGTELIVEGSKYYEARAMYLQGLSGLPFSLDYYRSPTDAFKVATNYAKLCNMVYEAIQATAEMAIEARKNK